MDDGALTIEIDEALAERLKAAAAAAGESLDDYVRHALEVFGAGDWDEIDRICDETEARGDGVALEDLRPWLQGWGKTPTPR